VFCFNDLLAVGALHTAAEDGLAVPDDLAVVGFDGSEEGAFTRPPLTTIAPDIAAIAEQAVALLGRPAGGHAPTEVITPFSLRVRGSTG
jgi:DNA-binding LacI/PurR family transcriptional regulator